MCIDEISFAKSLDETELSGSDAASSATDYEFDNLMCGSVCLKTGSNIAYVKNYKTEIDAAPIILNNRTYVPVRFLAEGFGAQVKWDDYEKAARIIYGAKEIKMTIGREWIWVNNEKVNFDAAPVVVNSRTMVPAAAFCKAAGMNICWDNRGVVVVTGPDITLQEDNAQILNKIHSLFDGVKKSGVMARVYVSPEGSDNNDGSYAAPLKTINAAKNKVREIMKKGMTGDIEVVLKDGTYAENITFTDEDSGLGHYKVIYKNEEGASPVVYGGNVVSGWEKYDDKIYKTHVGGEEFHVLTENGELSTKARFPNTDYAYVAENAQNTQTSFYYAKDLGMPNVRDKSGLEVYCWGGGGIAWAADILKASKFEPASRFIEMESKASYNMTVNSRFYLQGALEFLDVPGEFYYDKKNGDLYYYPKNLPIEEQEIAIPAQHNFIEFIGESKDKPVRNIKVEGIEFNTCDRNYDGIFMQCARNIEIDSVRLLNIGGNGVSINYYAYANRIKNSEIGNIGNHGVTMSNYINNDLVTTMYGKYNEVKNCEIYSVGRYIGHGSGINIGTGYNTVANCLIRDGHRMGINLSSPRPGTLIGKTVEGMVLDRSNVRLVTHSQNNHLMFNELYDVMNDSQDGGAIYSWGGDENNVVAYNHIHDTMTPFSEGHGIYLDDAADVFTVKKNIVDNMYREGFGGATMSSIFAKGVGHCIDNNFVVNSPENMYACMTESMVGEPCHTQSWYRNIVSNSGPYVYFNKAYTLNRFKNSDFNLYYNKTGEYKVNLGGYKGTAATDIYGWKQWFNGGTFDKFSLADVDPQFYDEENRDYRLLYTSDAYKLGITDIDEGDIGLTADYPYKKEEKLRKLYIDTSDSRIYGSTITLKKGDSIEINPFARTEISGYIVDAEGAEFKVSENNIAEISSDGILRAIASGAAKLTVSFGGLNTEFNVIVGDEWKEGVLYAKPSATIQTGKTIASDYYIKTDFGRTVKEFLTVQYSSADESVAAVDEDGNITGVSEGETKITAKISDGIQTIEASMEITVLDKVISEIRIKDGGLLTIVREKSEDLVPEYEVVYSDGTAGKLNLENAEFKSLGEEFFTVDENGVLTGNKLGKSTLNVAYTENGVTEYADFEVRVREVPLRADTFIWASSCDASYGVGTSASMETAIGDNDAGEWLLYKDVDFGNGGFSEFLAEYTVTAEYAGKVVQWRLDSPDGPVIGEIKVQNTGSWSNYVAQKVSMSNTELMKGVHDVYICNTQDGTGTLKGFILK